MGIRMLNANEAAIETEKETEKETETEIGTEIGTENWKRSRIVRRDD